MGKSFPIAMSPRIGRALSVVAAVGISLGYLLQALLPDGDGMLWGLEMLLKLSGLSASVFLFLSVYGQYALGKDSALDERQRDERNRAYYSTHRLIVGLLLGVSFYAMFAHPLGGWLPRGEDLIDLMFATAIGAMALPAAILAWRDRGIADDE